MDAEERQPRVRDRVDEAADEVARGRREPQVGAAEGHDARVGPRPGRLGQPGRPQPRAGHGAAGRDRLAGLEREDGAPVAALDARHRAAQADLSAPGGDVGGQRPGDGGEVDDAGGRRVQRGDAAHVGLDLGQRVRAEAPQAGHAVGAGAAFERVQPAQLVGADGDDDLARARQGDPVLGAEGLQELAAPPAQPRLQRPRRVVDAGVDDAAAVARLPGADRVRALQDDDPGAGAAHEQLARDGQADDPATGDRDVGVVRRAGHGRSLRPRHHGRP